MPINDTLAPFTPMRLHAPYIDSIGGDFYLVCPTCGWVSLALAFPPERIVCAVGEAEAHGQVNRSQAHRRQGDR